MKTQKPIQLTKGTKTFTRIELMAVITGCLTLATTTFAADGWQDLFNGKDLTGWEQHSGAAKYSVQDGVLTGTTVAGTPNSFLCTKQTYANFELELEFKCDPLLNSGVQFRSAITTAAQVVPGQDKEIKLPADRVHGYQCEIDMDVKRGRMWTGGIQEEAGRTWLFPNDGEKGAQGRAFSVQGRAVSKAGEWNKLRIVADGPSLKTWLNGEPRVDLTDSMTASGIIALQVHGIGEDEKKAGLKVSFRNLKIRNLPAK